MIEYKAMEMHCHTKHSDGTFTVERLMQAAKEKDYAGICLTDHNTMSGHQDILPELEAELLPVIRGIEWTTFFGHMQVLAADDYVDWRLATPDNIDEYVQKVHDVNGVAGAAHPTHPGSPLCTGCHWDYHVKNWDAMDYFEAWNGPNPAVDGRNIEAYQMWTDLLNQGNHLPASSGRDWHFPDKTPVNQAATYLGLKDGQITAENVKDAVRAGRTVVTAGPQISMEIQRDGKIWGLGERVPVGVYTVNYTVDEEARRSQWEQFGIRGRRIDIVQNGMPVESIVCDGSTSSQVDVDLWKGWVRMELVGECLEQDEVVLAFTSPIYIE